MKLSQPISHTIRNPESEYHTMVIHRLLGSATLSIANTPLAQSNDVLVIHESGKSTYPLRMYFPTSDINMHMLKPVSHKTYCPIKGEATYFNIICNNTSTADAAWMYTSTLSFDKNIALLNNRISFESNELALSLNTHN